MGARCAAAAGQGGRPGRTGSDNRLFVNGVLWVLRSGAHWHDLPERYGKWKTVHKRFSRWAAAGVWERVFADFGQGSRQPISDARLPPWSGPPAGDDRPGLRPKRGARSGCGAFPRWTDHQGPHACDSFGRPLRFLLAAGQSARHAPPPALLEGHRARMPFLPTAPMTPTPCGQLIADRSAPSAVIPSTRSASANPSRSDPLPTAQPHRATASTSSNTSAASPPATTGAPPLPRLHPSRRRHDLDALNVDST